MKLQTSLLAVFAAFQGAALAAPIPLTGTMTYNQNFDSLGTASVPWVDDSTLPGWLAEINDGTTATGNAQAADGNTVLSGLLNLGSGGATDRALGSKATGTGGFANIAYGIQFQNTSTNPVQLSSLRYTGELWLNNSTATNAETYTVFYAISPTRITDVISGGNSGTAAPGAGFTALGTGANWSAPFVPSPGIALDGNAPANRATVTFTPASSIIVPSGQFLVIKWTDSNIAGTDGFQGIDDVAIDFISAGDSDGDGANDADEAIMGTNPNNAADVLRLSQNPANRNLVTFPSKAGRFYKVYSSADLTSWAPTALATIVGNGNTQQFDVTSLLAQGRRFFRLNVKLTDGPWN